MQVCPLAAPTGDQDERLFEGAKRGGDRVGLGRLAVVNVANAVDQGDRLKSVRDAGERRDRTTNGVGGDAECEARRNGGEHVADAVIADQCDLADRRNPAAGARRGGGARWTCDPCRNDPAVNDPHPAGDRRLASIADRRHAPLTRQPSGHRIVEVHDQHAVIGDTRGEEALHSAVAIDCAVAIEVIDGDVGVHPNLHAADDRGELQLRDLHHDTSVCGQARGVTDQRSAVVPAELNGA